jgi:hypothetical protein
MLPSVKAFMKRLIDYAGLFPPAALPLEPAIHNYIAYQSGEDCWMLGRFIIPAAQLPELGKHMTLFSRERPLELSVLGERSSQAEETLTRLLACLQRVEAFRSAYGDSANIDVLELPLPPIGIDASQLASIASAVKPYGLQLFCELTFPFGVDWEASMLAALDEIAACNRLGDPKIGVKLRTGGVTAEAFPSLEQVAVILAGCRDRRLSMKFTAGLHHPVRMFRNEVNAKMHGFLNVFAAGLLAHACELETGEMVEILGDENPANFIFTAKGLQWKHRFISCTEIDMYRKTLLCSYGSCSFDEPRSELRELQLLE